jgi:ABC-type multidrug transport system fused ATPase/permease subunit
LSSGTHERRSPRLPPELLWLIKQIRPLLHWHLASFLCLTAGSLLALLSPLLLKWLIDCIIPERRTGLLLLVVTLIFLGHQGRVALTSLGSYLMLSASQKMGLILRVRLLEHLDTLSADYYEDTPVGVAMYPLKEPIEEISYFGSDLLPAILRMLLTTAFTLAAMSALSPVLTLTVLPLIPTFLVTRQYFRRKLATDADAAQADRLAWDNFLEEHLSSVISIQLLGQEKRQERRAFRLLARWLRSQQRLYRTAAWFTFWSSLAIVLAMSAVIGYGAMSVLAGILSVGSLVAFYGFVTQLFDPLSGASELYARAQKTFASIRQVQGAFALRSSVRSATGALMLSGQGTAEIEFAAVEFGYPRNKDLLHVPSLRIVPGEQIAIAGENGAGKSTLVRLIARLYDPVSGEVRFGGEDVRNIDQEPAPGRLLSAARPGLVRWHNRLQSAVRPIRSLRAADRRCNPSGGVVRLGGIAARRSSPADRTGRLPALGWGASTPRPRESASARTEGVDSGRGHLLPRSGRRKRYSSRTSAKSPAVDLHRHLAPAFHVFNFRTGAGSLARTYCP